MSGIFVSKGMTFRIPDGGLSLSLGDDGKPHMGLTLQVVFDVCPSWLEISIEHLKAAKTYNALRTMAWQQNDENAKARSFENEFKASMQAMVAASVAIDSFYASIQQRVKMDEGLIQTWRQKKTPRYSQIAETLRIAFQLTPKGLKSLRDALKQIYQFRDRAVHPSSTPSEPILHPEIKVGVEWRFVAFRYENTLPLVRVTLQIIDQLVAIGKPVNEDVTKYAAFLKPQLKLFLSDELFAVLNASATN